MQLKTMFINVAVVFFVLGLSTAAFVDIQSDIDRDRWMLPLGGDSANTDPLFESHVSDVMPEQTAYVILAAMGLTSQLMMMLAFALGAIGFALQTIDFLGELFAECLNAIRRLFLIRRDAHEENNLDPGDDDGNDMGGRHGTRPVAPIPPTNPMLSRPPINRSRSLATT